MSQVSQSQSKPPKSNSQSKPETEQEIMARLRKPIDELVDRYCADKTELQRLRLRQLAWQAIDVLARTGNVAFVKEDKNIQRIILNIREVGASEEFIKESLALAVAIYREMQIAYPCLLETYGGKK